jgi:putative DNA primase/helicase
VRGAPLALRRLGAEAVRLRPLPDKGRITDATSTRSQRSWPGRATMMSLNLHAEALADLRRSGLDDATIGAAGLYTPARGDLPRLLNPRLVDEVRHVLVFPYDSVSHGGLWRRKDEFVRCKLFPPVSDGQGHTIRYYQRAGTPPRLYVPVPARVSLADPSVPLLITEGEKKALKANQDGLTCIAVGGLWNWQVGGRPIADLGRIDWCDRETLIVPDSDAWMRPDLLRPVFALGKELEERGQRSQW